MKTYINLKLGYCPKVWMMHGRAMNKKGTEYMKGH